MAGLSFRIADFYEFTGISDKLIYRYVFQTRGGHSITVVKTRARSVCKGPKKLRFVKLKTIQKSSRTSDHMRLVKFVPTTGSIITVFQLCRTMQSRVNVANFMVSVCALIKFLTMPYIE